MQEVPDDNGGIHHHNGAAEYHYCVHLFHDGDVNIYDNGAHAQHRRLNHDGHRGVLHNLIQFAVDHYPDIVIAAVEARDRRNHPSAASD